MKRLATLREYDTKRRKFAPSVVIVLDDEMASKSLKKRYDTVRSSFRQLASKRERPSLYIPVELYKDEEYVIRNLIRMQRLCQSLHESGISASTHEFSYTRKVMKHAIEKFSLPYREVVLQMLRVGTPGSIYFPDEMTLEFAENVLEFDASCYLYFPERLKAEPQLALSAMNKSSDEELGTILDNILREGLIDNKAPFCTMAITRDLHLSSVIIDALGLEQYCSQVITVCELRAIIEANRIQFERERETPLISLIDIACDIYHHPHKCSGHAHLIVKEKNGIAALDKSLAMGVLRISPCEYSFLSAELKIDADIIDIQLMNNHTHDLPLHLIDLARIRSLFPDGNVPYNVQVLMRKDREFILWILGTNPKALHYSTIHHPDCDHFMNDEEVVETLNRLDTLQMIRLYKPCDWRLLEEYVQYEPLLFLYSSGPNLREKNKIIERVGNLPRNLSSDVLVRIHDIYKSLPDQLRKDSEIISAFAKTCFIDPDFSDDIASDERYCASLIEANHSMAFVIPPCTLKKMDLSSNPIRSTRQVWRSVLHDPELFLNICSIPGVVIDGLLDPIYMENMDIYPIIHNYVESKLIDFYHETIFCIERRLENEDEEYIEDHVLFYLIDILSRFGVVHHSIVNLLQDEKLSLLCERVGYSESLNEIDYKRRMEFFYPGLL